MDITALEIFRAFGFLFVGLLLVALCVRYFKIDSGAMLVGVLFAPILIFLAASGRLVEFKGLGVEAKFQQAANQPVKPKAEKIRPLASSGKEIRDSNLVRRAFAIGIEVVLITAGQEDRAVTSDGVLDVAQQIYPGLLEGNFVALVVLDESERPLGYFPRSFFWDLLRIEILQTVRGKRTRFDSERVSEQLEQTQLWDIVATPRVRAEADGTKTTVRASASNAEALSVMTASHIPAVVVVDDAGKYAGIVRRDDIVSTLVAALAGHSAQDAMAK